MNMTKDYFTNLYRLLEVEFIQQALFELIEEKGNYSPLLVINHQDYFLSLSNESYYVFLLPVVTPKIAAKVCNYCKYIFNRKTIMVQLENSESIPMFEHQFFIKLKDIIQQAEHNGIMRNNLFLRLLSEV
ncbi:hypothetical protein RM549_03000 [Salegentibacter sp. F188]|uniref:Uncharacterized protein n=1 Tax=Autumnicola patrickiae TaxID=3075591 RepID=A0ABU3DYC8_9FLAO|nr:hypothetical protein [Salegentibacter sp. F188]MDT0688733.1 hypothetical protein [Salegentibacter sp. F188]